MSKYSRFVTKTWKGSLIGLPKIDTLGVSRIENKNWPYTDHQLSVCTTGKPMFYLPLSSKFGSPGATWYCTSLDIHVVMNWQLSKRYLLTSIIWLYRGLRYWPIEVEDFFKVICWQVTSFQMIAGLKFIFFHSYGICGIYVTIAPHYWDFDFKLTSDAKIEPVI